MRARAEKPSLGNAKGQTPDQVGILIKTLNSYPYNLSVGVQAKTFKVLDSRKGPPYTIHVVALFVPKLAPTTCPHHRVCGKKYLFDPSTMPRPQGGLCVHQPQIDHEIYDVILFIQDNFSSDPVWKMNVEPKKCQQKYILSKGATESRPFTRNSQQSHLHINPVSWAFRGPVGHWFNLTQSHDFECIQLYAISFCWIWNSKLMSIKKRGDFELLEFKAFHVWSSIVVPAPPHEAVKSLI